MRPAPAKETAGEAVVNDMSIDAVLARFDGDARAALDAALHDIIFLQHEAMLASLAMSYGYARGWQPKVMA
jgi:hypothetical protein